MSDITATTPLVRNQEIICGDVDGELIALKIDTGSYLNLNTTASHILNLFAEADGALTPQQICARLRQVYRVSEEQCLQDVLSLARRCVELDMLRLASAA